jgi:hypothetical protein
MERETRKTGCMPRILPTVQLPDGIYAIDLRLKEFRSADSPWRIIPFDSDVGRQWCDQANVLTCQSCGTRVIVSGVLRQEELWCCSCLALLSEPEQD